MGSDHVDRGKIMTWLVISGVLSAVYLWYMADGFEVKWGEFAIIWIGFSLVVFVGGLAINWLILGPLGIYLNNSQIPGYYDRY